MAYCAFPYRAIGWRLLTFGCPDQIQSASGAVFCRSALLMRFPSSVSSLLFLVALGWVATACESTEPPWSAPTPLCCHGIGQCLPGRFIPEEQRDFLGTDSCAGDLLCVPSDFVDDEAFVPLSCRSLLDAEGRCVPECLPDVLENADRMPRDACPEFHVCAPCFDPMTAASTGLCDFANDPGPTEDPKTFDFCCHDLGRCFPGDLVDEDYRDNLAADSCGEDMFCTPEAFTEDDFVLQDCRGVLGSEGRCVPDCLNDLGDQVELMPVDVCPEFHRCLPCYDLRDGESTGLCELGADPGPRHSARTFPACCDGAGYCTPSDMIPEEERDALGQDECADGYGLLCVPKEFTEDDYVPAVCESTLGAEGRCVPSCLPDLADQAELLPQDICDAGSVCAPCYDPISGDDTTLCDIGGGTGPTELPVIFADCCGGEGRCLPSESIPDDERDALGEDSCPDGKGLLCLPEFMLEDEVPLTCLSLLDAEGRCLPACLPDLVDQADLLTQDICQDGYLCAPCNDLDNGEDTGVCGLPGDPGPVRPPVLFERCCGGEGACLPSSVIPEETRDQISAGTCSSAPDLICLPDSFREDGYVPSSCVSMTEAEGRCLPECIDGMDNTQLPSEGCPERHRCAPCYDPLSGESLGTCEMPGDPGPTEEPVIFDDCCEAQGTTVGKCVPLRLVPEKNQEDVLVDSCTQSAHVCAPTAMMQDPDSGVIPCATGGLFGGGDPGGCVPGCYLSAFEALLSPRAGCPLGYNCAPCEQNNEPTGVCN